MYGKPVGEVVVDIWYANEDRADMTIGCRALFILSDFGCSTFD